MPITEALYGKDHPSKRRGPAPAARPPRNHTFKLIEQVPQHIRGQLQRRFPKARTVR